MLNGNTREFQKNGNNNIIKNNINSFNQMHSLQLLIQKHSGLKELCKLNLILL